MSKVIDKSINTSLPSYCVRYGWTADPFNTSTDKAPYYIPTSWDQYLDVVQHIYQTENTLLAIIGAHGSGKSTFIKHILLQIDSNTLTCVLNANNALNNDLILSSLSELLNLPKPHGDTLEETFDNQLSAMQHNPHNCLLIIDDAHSISQEVLQLIYYFIEQQTDYQMRLHIILIGDVQLKHNLDSISLKRTKQIKMRTLSLQGFNHTEVTQYLQHRINSVTQHSQVPFDTNTIMYIQKQSSGDPLLINKIVQQLLLNGNKQKIITDQPEKKVKTFAHQNWYITGLLVLVALLTLTAHWWSAFKSFHLNSSNNITINHDILTNQTPNINNATNSTNSTNNSLQNTNPQNNISPNYNTGTLITPQIEPNITKPPIKKSSKKHTTKKIKKIT